MNTLQINGVLIKHVKYFQGVYPTDLLPITLLKPSIIVINLDKHYIPGSHWVALYFSDTGCTEYFDSYGLPPYRLELTTYLQLHSMSYTFNRHREQDITSRVCGHYCCIYALHSAKVLSMMSFVNMFSPTPYNCNDMRVVRILRVHFGECPACNRLEEGQQSYNSQL